VCLGDGAQIGEAEVEQLDELAVGTALVR